MAERRSLLEGLKEPEPTIDPVKAKEFVFGKTKRAVEPAPAANIIDRTPLSTRIRKDFFAALKRASLERQLNGQGTSTLIEILEEAVEPWLKSNGYLP